MRVPPDIYQEAMSEAAVLAALQHTKSDERMYVYD